MFPMLRSPFFFFLALKNKRYEQFKRTIKSSICQTDIKVNMLRPIRHVFVHGVYNSQANLLMSLTSPSVHAPNASNTPHVTGSDPFPYPSCYFLCFTWEWDSNGLARNSKRTHSFRVK